MNKQLHALKPRFLKLCPKATKKKKNSNLGYIAMFCRKTLKTQNKVSLKI